MSTPYRFTPRIPAPPHPTPASASAYILPNPKPGKAPIRNPYDKFTQPEFDAWIGGITGALRRALGHAEEETESTQKSQSTQSEKPPETPHYVQIDLEESEDEVINDSFAEIKARRAAGKGKARDPREGPGLGQADIAQPIEIPSSDEEEEEEVELTIANLEDSDSDGAEQEEGEDQGDEEGEEEEYSEGEEYSMTRGQSSSRPMSSAQHPRKRITMIQRDEDEDEEEAEYEEYDEEYDEEGEPVDIQRSSPTEADLIEIISDDESPTQSIQKRQVREQSYEQAEGERVDDDEEYEYSGDEYNENVPLETSRLAHPDSLIRRPREDPDYLEDNEEDMLQDDDEIEEVQPPDDDTSFPPRVSASLTEVKRVVEIPDHWNGPRTYAQDYYSGGDIRLPPGSYMDAHRLGSGDVDFVEEVSARKGQDEEDDVIQPLDIDTSFPPDEAQDAVIEIPDQWNGPRTYAQDFYSGGDIQLPLGVHMDAHHLGTGDEDPIEELAARKEQDEEDDEIQPLDVDTSFPPDEAQDGVIEISDQWEGPQIYAQDFYSGGDIRTLPGDCVDASLLTGTGDVEDDISAFLTPDVLTPSQANDRLSLEENEEEFILPPSPASHYVMVAPRRDVPIPAEAQIISIDDSDEEVDVKLPESAGMLDSIYDDAEQLEYEPEGNIYGDMEQYGVSEAGMTLEHTSAGIQAAFSFEYEECQSINDLAEEHSEVISNLVNWNNPPAFPTGLPASASGHLATPSSEGEEPPLVKPSQEAVAEQEEESVAKVDTASPVTASPAKDQTPSKDKDDANLAHRAEIVEPEVTQTIVVDEELPLEVVTDSEGQVEEQTAIAEEVSSITEGVIAPAILPETALVQVQVIVDDVTPSVIRVDSASILMEGSISETEIAISTAPTVLSALEDDMMDIRKEEVPHTEADVPIVEEVTESESKASEENPDTVAVDEEPGVTDVDVPTAESSALAVEIPTQAEVPIADVDSHEGASPEDDEIRSTPGLDEEGQQGQAQTANAASSASGSTAYSYIHHSSQTYLQGQLPTPPSEKARSLPPMDDEDEISIISPPPKKHQVEVEVVSDEGEVSIIPPPTKHEVEFEEVADKDETPAVSLPTKHRVEIEEVSDEDANVGKVLPGEPFESEMDIDLKRDTTQEYTVFEVITDDDGNYTDEDGDGEVDQEVIEVISVTSSSDRWEAKQQIEEDEYIVEEPVTEGRLTEEPADHMTSTTKPDVEPAASVASQEAEEEGRNVFNHAISCEPSPEGPLLVNEENIAQGVAIKEPRPVEHGQVDEISMDKDALLEHSSTSSTTIPTPQVEGPVPVVTNAEAVDTTPEPYTPPMPSSPLVELSEIPQSPRLTEEPMRASETATNAPPSSVPHDTEQAGTTVSNGIQEPPPRSSAPLAGVLPKSEAQIIEETSTSQSTGTDVFGEIKITSIEAKSVSTKFEATTADPPTNSQKPSHLSMTMGMIPRNSSVPILMADPYPYSLSTPRGSNAYPIVYVSEEDTGLDNSMSSNSTIEKVGDLEKKNTANILDDLEDLELQYPSEVETEQTAVGSTSNLPTPTSTQLGSNLQIQPSVISSSILRKTSDVATMSKMDIQNKSRITQTGGVAGKSSEMPSRPSQSPVIATDTKSESKATVASESSAQTVKPKQAYKRKRDAAPSANQTTPQITAKPTKAKAKKASKTDRKAKLQELEAPVPGPSSEETIYVRPRPAGAAKEALPRTASDTPIATHSSNIFSNYKALQSPSRSASIVSSAPSDKAQPSPMVIRPSLPHVQSLPPISLFHAHGKQKQNLVAFPPKIPKQIQSKKPPPLRTPSTSHISEQPMATPPSAPITVPTDTNDIASTSNSSAPAGVYTRPSPPAPARPTPTMSVDSYVPPAPSVASPLPATPSASSPAPATASVPVATPSTPSVNHPAPTTPSLTSSVSALKRNYSTPMMSSPVTRSHCRYHRISLPKEDGGPRVCFLVPGCSLNDKELMEEEEIEDHGDATHEDSYRMIKDIESLQFHSDLIGVLRQLVGLDILREQEIFYLPQPGEEVTRRTTYKKPSISERTAMIRVPGESSSHAGSPSYSGFVGSPVSHKGPGSVADSTSTSLSALRNNLASSEKGSTFAPTDTEGGMSDDEEPHTKRARPSPPEENKVMGPPTAQSKSKGKSKAKPRKSKKATGTDFMPEHDEEGKVSEPEKPARKPRKLASSRRGVKRSRTSEGVAGEEDGDRNSKKLKTHPTAPPSLLSPEKLAPSPSAS